MLSQKFNMKKLVLYLNIQSFIWRMDTIIQFNWNVLINK